MGKAIYFNVPCTIFHNALETDKRFIEALGNVLDFILYDACKAMYKSRLDADEIKKKVAGYNINYFDPISTWKRGEALYIELVEKAKFAPAYFSISSKMYWHFRNEETTDFDRALFLAYLAVKSMVGKRDMIRTNMAAICSRMDGNTRPKDITNLSDSVKIYLNRYWSNKLLNALFEKRGVTFYGGNSTHKVRGFYCSTTLTMEELIIKAEADMKERRSRPKDLLKEAKKAALSKIQAESP